MKRGAPVPRLPLRVALKRSIAVSAVAFALLMAVLTVRMATGDDPALGPKLATRTRQPTPSATTAPTPVIVTSDESGDEEGEGEVGVVVPSAPPGAITQPAPPPSSVQTTTS